LYGFESERAFGDFLRRSPVILDAGSGTGMKAAWFATLAPDSEVVAAEISDAVYAAAQHYRSVGNLHFIKCDLGNLGFIPADSFDYVSCDQVIHHTANPPKTFDELVRVTRNLSHVSCYVYRKKAIPRELLDEEFRGLSMKATHDELFAMAEQVTDLGKLLASVEGGYDFPAIPALEITGGRMSIQRFFYWNFFKCCWNPELGYKNSVLGDFDWYSPSQAFRYREEEFLEWIKTNSLEIVHFHREHACYSGRFRKHEEPNQAN
jgi:SAM-dependent methyltransferase